MTQLLTPKFKAVQDRQRAMLKEQQAKGIPLVQRRFDGVYVSRHKDGTEDILPFQDRPDAKPFK